MNRSASQQADVAPPKLRTNGCPVCRRPLHLDFAGVIDADGDPAIDVYAVHFAMQLHLATCAG